MSRALGAAFLGHQVAQLENRINNKTSISPSSSPRGGATRGGRGGGRGGGGRIWNPDRNGGQGAPRIRKRSFSLHPEDAKPAVEGEATTLAPPLPIVPVVKDRPIMANVIILDASVLVYALGQVKRWCKEERKETLIVPLEGESLPMLRGACTDPSTFFNNPQPRLDSTVLCFNLFPSLIAMRKSSIHLISSRKAPLLSLYMLEQHLVSLKRKLVSTLEFRSSATTSSVHGTMYTPRPSLPTPQLLSRQPLLMAIPFPPKIVLPNG